MLRIIVLPHRLRRALRNVITSPKVDRSSVSSTRASGTVRPRSAPPGDCMASVEEVVTAQPSAPKSRLPDRVADPDLRRAGRPQRIAWPLPALSPVDVRGAESAARAGSQRARQFRE
jgi:hypothetical protein